MNRKSIRIGVCAKSILGALALAVASVSYASGILVGGGSTMPAIGYVGYSLSALVYPPGTGSLFTVAGVNASYCKTSDTVALDVFLGEPVGIVGSGYSVQGTCPNEGFGAGTEDRKDLTQPSYVALDMPLGDSDYGNYQASHGDSAYPTQFPAMAGSIAIGFNLNDSLGNPVTTANFTDAQICGILDGTFTDWSQVASAFTLTDGGTIPAGVPINVQYRSEGNGATFGLSNHLSNVCGETSAPYFQTGQSFNNVVAGFFPNGMPSGNGTTTPLWAGSSGNAAVANAIANTANSFGYVETANALALDLSTLQIADVNGLSPTVNFGAALNVSATAVLYNEVISSTNNTNGTAEPVPISSIITDGETAPPSTSQCIVLVKPSLYAKPGVKGGLIPVTGTYPIVAMTYLLNDAQGVEATDLANVQNLADAPYNSNYTSSVNTVGSGTGLAFLSVASNVFSSTAPGECVNSGE